MTFFSNYLNLALIAIALISGALLAIPTLMRRGGGLSTHDATNLINRRNAVVVDVRDATAFASGHLPQAKHVPLAELATKAPQLAKNKATPMIVVCQSGQQTGKALAALQAAGYTEVHGLDGGLDGWVKAGMPVIKQGVAK